MLTARRATGTSSSSKLARDKSRVPRFNDDRIKIETFKNTIVTIYNTCTSKYLILRD